MITKFHDQTVKEINKVIMQIIEKKEQKINIRLKKKTFEKYVHETFLPKRDLKKKMEIKRRLAIHEISKLPSRKALNEVKENSDYLLDDYELVI